MNDERYTLANVIADLWNRGIGIEATVMRDRGQAVVHERDGRRITFTLEPKPPELLQVGLHPQLVYVRVAVIRPHPIDELLESVSVVHCTVDRAAEEAAKMWREAHASKEES